jgi:hypothetical protein
MNDTNDATSGNERNVENPLFAGSNPAARTIFNEINGFITLSRFQKP